jgi:DNA polymerase-3 subunit alpha
VNCNDEGIKLIAGDIMALKDVEDEIRITIRKSQENAEVFCKLKEAFIKYNGSNIVYLHLLDSKRMIKTERQFWLNPSFEAIHAIENILGKGSVEVI